MSDYSELREKDLMDAGVLYKAYKDYMYLFNFLRDFRNQYKFAVSRDEMRSRIDYILKNQVRQRDEISTLCWILGEEDVRKSSKIND